MAIFKAGILAFAFSFSVPLTSVLSQLHPIASVQSTVTTASVQRPFPGSVIYKTETGFPDFMTKKSLPVRHYWPAPKPHSMVSNQTIAAL